MICAGCGDATPAAGRFCIHCGAPAQRACPACGEPVIAGARFCMQCGTQLVEGEPAAQDAKAASTAERRLVSVLFADLVGFTTLSEHRDPEEVRELLSSYFDRCRTLIERYGGTVEKFIGDAVMAVWGTPVAREDDPERAVRAALALTAMVTALGEEVGMPELRVRAGVLTGSASVEIGAEAEGMVLGDTVNTASRLQSIAAPGTVLVDDVTRRASEAAIAYEDAGSHNVKGREGPVHAWTALRVVAGAGGARRSAGLEAPFVGRERELRAIIDAGERSAHERRAQHVTIVGEAGSGKSRLLWEFFKYLDGIEETRWWHQGRCLAYGEGVGYWALAEMIRARAGITEEESPASARAKLTATVEKYVPEERDRRLIEPRLAHLLRLEDRPDADRADLFSGWRLFLERMAATDPVILAFEDLQWADSGLLDFIDYLLEWAPDSPIFVLTFARTELLARRAAWQPVMLEPLEDRSVAAILDGLAPGLPEDVVGDITRRAEGIPLYAVETIRMLMDRGLLVQEGSRYRVAGDVSNLEVPETLHALVASRLDGLSGGERSLLQDASVIGHSFTSAAAAAVSGRSEREVESTLDALVTKQVLGRDDDPRSPERGQYVFLQGLLRTVAYGTLSRRARKARHVEAAHYLERAWPGEAADIAEVLASHYQEAIRADPEAEDVPELRASARARLAAAGRSAASLALGPEAARYFEQAAELAEGDLERAELVEQAGRALWLSGEIDAAELRLRSAIELYVAGGIASGGSSAVALGTMFVQHGRSEEAGEVLEPFRVGGDPQTEPTIVAHALATLSSALRVTGQAEEGDRLLEQALVTLEAEQSWAPLAEALCRKSFWLFVEERPQEGMALARQALVIAEAHDLASVALRARYSLVGQTLGDNRFEEGIDQAAEAVALARERGDRPWERAFIGLQVGGLVVLGRWDEATALAMPQIAGQRDLDAMGTSGIFALAASARGDEELCELCSSNAQEHRDSANADMWAAAALVDARMSFERGQHRQALELAQRAVAAERSLDEGKAEAFWLSIDAAIALADEQAIDQLAQFVPSLERVSSKPILLAGQARLAAEQAYRRGDPDAADCLEQDALGLLRSVGAKPYIARILIDRTRRRDDAAAAAEARELCEELGATRWLTQLGQASGVTA